MPLGARTWVGDGVGGASVAADGTVDWCCPWNLAGPAACSALLDPRGGALRVGPVRRCATGGAGVHLPPHEIGWLPGAAVSSLVLEASGGRRLSVVDLISDGRLVRVVRALSGPIDVEVEYRPPMRPVAPRRVTTAPWGVAADRVAVRAGTPLVATPIGRDDTIWRGVRRLEAGEVVVVTLGLVADEPLTAGAAQGLVADVPRWWAPIAGPYAAAVERALVLVRSLTPPGGAPVAAGTTSLPRWVGAERTGDERFVRLRHAATAARLLPLVGLGELAADAEQWLRTAVEASSWPYLPALAADGSTPAPLEEVPLEGWRGSGPVVRGRSDPADLGALGDVVAAVSASTGGDERSGTVGGPLAGPLTGAWPALVAATDRLSSTWADADGGIWGLPARRHVTSRLRAWGALDRMARLARAADPLSLDAVGWQQSSREVLASLVPDAEGALGADAALLALAWSGPWPSAHPVVRATVDRCLERLTDGPWLRRYEPSVDDGIGGTDGADVEATCWAVRAEALLGRWEAAHARMEALCALPMPSTAVDPLSGDLRGDLPSTGAALALTEAALALAAGPT